MNVFLNTHKNDVENSLFPFVTLNIRKHNIRNSYGLSAREYYKWNNSKRAICEYRSVLQYEVNDYGKTLDVLPYASLPDFL